MASGLHFGLEMRVRRLLLRSRLLHFGVLGFAIFAFARREEDGRNIAISKASLDALHAAQAQHLEVASISPELAHEVDAREIEDEVLYREALRMGLDKDDPIIRQRLVQKLLLIVEDLGGASRAPTDAELRAYFESTREKWRKPATYRVEHVFARTKERLPAEIAMDAGDPFPYPRTFTQSKKEIAQTYGVPFSDFVTTLAPGTVSDPIASSFGWHRVRLLETVPGGLASFDEARADLLLDYMLVRRERITGTWLAKTVARYRITIDGKRIEGFLPTRRVAARPDWSAED